MVLWFLGGVGTSSLDIVWATNAMKSRTRTARLISFGQVCLHLRGVELPYGPGVCALRAHAA